jgi:hypothetical protein
VAPERVAGDPATPQSDLYAMGVVLYEALAGAKPFEGNTPVAIAYAIRHERPTPLAERCPDLPPRVTAAVERAMARDPRARFATAADMAAALDVAPVAADDITVIATGAAAAVPDATTVMPTAAPEPSPVDRARATAVEALADPDRARTIAIAAAAVCFVLLLVAGVAYAATAGSGSASADRHLADGLRGIAAGLTTNDGQAAASAATGLRDLAPLVEKGKGGPEASALLAKLASWRDGGQLTPVAADRAAAIVKGVPGVDGAAFTPPTTAAPPPTTAAPVAGSNGKDRGKAKHDGNNDD